MNYHEVKKETDGLSKPPVTQSIVSCLSQASSLLLEWSKNINKAFNITRILALKALRNKEFNSKLARGGHEILGFATILLDHKVRKICSYKMIMINKVIRL